MTSSRVRVVVCSGTACFVMGGSELLLVEEHLGAGLRERVDVEASPCLGLCRGREGAGAPFATVDGEEISRASLRTLVDAIAARIEATR